MQGQQAMAGTRNSLYTLHQVEVLIHLSKNCSYLKLSIQGVDKDIVGELRNKDGSIYYACDDCGNRDSSRVFVTDYGNRYHTTLQCSGLKRTIYLVPISQAQGRTPCSKCN